ncbi:hypothetical protein GCM10027578_28130 [Spirosoma luteolum]
MNRRVLIGIGLVVVALAGWLGYRQMHPPGRLIGSLMPSGALLVLASDRLQDTVSAQTLRTEISLQQLPIFAEARQRLDAFLYAATDSATAQAFIKGKNVRYSLHTISKTTLDYIIYIPVGSSDQAFLTKLTNPDPRFHRILNHTFRSEKILDLVSRSGEQLGSFIVTDDFLVVSPSGILMENVAARLHQPLALPQPEPTFQVDADHWAGLSIRPEILQSLFDKTGSLVRIFLPETIDLVFRPSASRTHLIGYAADAIGNRRDVATLFEGQTPRRIQSAALIPQTTATLYHIGITDPVRFGRSMSQLLSSASGDFLRDRFNQIKSATVPFYRAMGADLLLCRLESSSGTDQQVLILNAGSPQTLKTLSAAYQEAAFLAGARGALTPKSFLGHKILRLDVPELPASLFSRLFAGFPQSWITQHGTSLVVTNSEAVMQDYLQQVQRGAVWAADDRQVDLLGTTLRPANFTAFVRLNRLATDRAQPVVTASWPPAWQNLLDHQTPDGAESSFANLENMAYQASYGNDNILSTLVLGRTTRQASKAVLNRLLLQKKIEFGAPLVSAPVVTGSLIEGLTQFYAQTGGGQLVFTTPDGEQMPQATLDGPIRSNALAVDFLNNGRLQYLFMTDQTLYVADPGPRATALRSIRLPAGLDPTYLTRPQGTLQRNWLALAVHTDGSVYALDRQRQSFVRIMSPRHKGALQLPLQVRTTPTGITVLAAQQNGTINYWQENGSQFPHFPVQIQRRTEEDPEVKLVGPALLPTGQTQLLTITDEGQLIRISTAGQIVGRTQLYRPIRSGVFRLFPDEAQTNWLLLRSTDTEAAILDQKGQQRFDVRALQPGQHTVRYHRLGAGIELVSVQSGEFTTLYDLNGRIIGDRPIPGNFPVALQFDAQTNELYVLSAAQKAVQLFSIRMR